ncbi:MAG: phosphate ABC transporter ATP-binding protein PstB [Fuerstiella sp.]
MLSIDQVTVSYGQRAAVKDVCLQVPAGSITAIVGPSGCGKSSLLLAVNRMCEEIAGAAVTGRITVDGKDVQEDYRYVPDLRRDVGMIFQKPNPFPASIRRNIELALREHGTRNRDQRFEVCREVLQATGLWEEVKGRLDESALQLSGGQQQRLCLARALAIRPKLLLMDEPCSALDPNAARHVERLISSLRKTLTVLIVTHNLAQAKRISDQMAVFWYQDGVGKLIESGPTEKLFRQPEHDVTRAYLSGEDG